MTLPSASLLSASSQALAAQPGPCTASPEARLTVYFDGACPLCSLEIGHYAGQEGAEQIAFVDAAAAGCDTGPGLGRDAALARFHARLPDGTLVSGARAFVAVWETLPRWRWAARVARVPGVMALLEGAYRAFLPVRPALSRLAGRLGARLTAVERAP